MRIENRNHPRVAINWPVMILRHKQPWYGMTENISAGGVFVSCNAIIPRRESLSMILIPPKHTALKIIVQTVWENVRPLHNNKAQIIGVGTRFLKIAYLDRQFLTTIFSDYLKSEYEKQSSTSKISNWPFMTFDRIELHRLKCHLCKAYLLIGPAEETCPVCGNLLPRLQER